tara:strand:+ start:502 stop:1254 length:753 start_codon:yes stop_codon:yes gene_type:complete
MRPMEMDDELDFFFDKIMDEKPFALVRWGDGEIKLLNKTHFHRNEVDIQNLRLWDFDSTDPHQLECAKRITDSLYYEDEGLFCGIPCPSCPVCHISGMQYYELYKCKENLTYVGLFWNANYEEFQRTFPYIVKDKNVVFIGNETANLNGLPFPITSHFKVGTNAWLNDYSIIEDLLDYLRNSAKKGTVFLFACGPLSCYLITEMWKESKEHFLIDIGSAYDANLYNRPTRGYHSGKGGVFGKTCQWMKKV